jgi:protein-tyrosine phosphatase
MDGAFTWIVPDRLAVGGAEFSTRLLLDNRIDVVICVAPLDEVPSAPLPDHRFPVSLRLPDRVSALNMKAAAEACASYAAVGKAVYLHCVMGFNRSAAVAVLTVERIFRISRQEAREYVSCRRRVDVARHLQLHDVFFPDDSIWMEVLCSSSRTAPA